MKRSGPIERHTPLLAKVALKVRKPWPDPGKPRSRLPRQSAKRKAEAPIRADVRAQALHRAQYRCELEHVVPEIRCWHPVGEPLDVDEIAQRGVAPGGHLDINNVQVCCRAHHDWKTNHRVEAEKRGVRMSGAEYERRRRP